MPRAYSSPLRDAEAAVTRARIVDAAHALFVRDGYGATPMRAIAAEAGVSVQTVNLHGPKSSLLLAAYERALAGEEGWSTLNTTDAMASIVAETDIPTMLARYAAYMAEANARIAAISRAVRAAADTDPAVRELAAAIEGRRMRSIREGVAVFADRLGLDSAGAEHLTTLTALLVSHDTYLHLTASGWGRERYEAWLRGELARLVGAAS